LLGLLRVNPKVLMKVPYLIVKFLTKCGKEELDLEDAAGRLSSSHSNYKKFIKGT
jgi:hypothetical protein